MAFFSNSFAIKPGETPADYGVNVEAIASLTHEQKDFHSTHLRECLAVFHRDPYLLQRKMDIALEKGLMKHLNCRFLPTVAMLIEELER